MDTSRDRACKRKRSWLRTSDDPSPRASAPAHAGPGADADTYRNVSGQLSSHAQRAIGQVMRTARPTTVSMGMKPPPGSLMCTRESLEPPAHRRSGPGRGVPGTALHDPLARRAGRNLRMLTAR